MLLKQISSAIGYGLLFGFLGLSVGYITIVVYYRSFVWGGLSENGLFLSLAGIIGVIIGVICGYVMIGFTTGFLGTLLGNLIFLISAIGFITIGSLIYEIFIYGYQVEGEELLLLTMMAIVGICSMIIGIIYGFIKPAREEAKHRREETERRRKEEAARLQHHKEEQEGHYKQMVNLCEGSLATFELIPKYLDSAEKWLDKAEANFAEGAFAPFWDSVESAANCLAHFDEGVCQIKDKSSNYSELTGKYEDTPPRFIPTPQSVERLGASTATAKRMKTIVRAAQRNFQFAVIYEQRKTNQILVAGFETLAEALEGMIWQITTSLDALADSVNTSSRAIDSRLDKIAAMSEQHHSEAAERERKVVEKLDKIQHTIQCRRK